MKIYLKQSIKGIGRAGEVKDFPSGYAQNFIIKKGYGIVATDDVIKNAVKNELHTEELKKENEIKTLKSLEQLDGKTITIKVQANEFGNLFSSIGKKDVLNEIRPMSMGFVNDQILDDFEPIKKIGAYKIGLTFGVYKFNVNLVINH